MRSVGSPIPFAGGRPAAIVLLLLLLLLLFLLFFWYHATRVSRTTSNTQLFFCIYAYTVCFFSSTANRRLFALNYLFLFFFADSATTASDERHRSRHVLLLYQYDYVLFRYSTAKFGCPQFFCAVHTRRTVTCLHTTFKNEPSQRQGQNVVQQPNTHQRQKHAKFEPLPLHIAHSRLSRACKCIFFSRRLRCDATVRHDFFTLRL